MSKPFYNFYCIICGKRFKAMRVDAKTCCLECRVALSQISKNWTNEDINDNTQNEVDKKIELVKTGASPDVIKEFFVGEKNIKEKTDNKENNKKVK